MFRVAATRTAAAVLSAATRSAAAPRALGALSARRFEMPVMRWYSTGGALTRNDIQERIFHLLQDFDKVNQDKLSPNADFAKDLGLDSLDTVEVVMAIEEEFSVEIPDDEADKISSVKEAIDYISKRDDAH